MAFAKKTRNSALVGTLDEGGFRSFAKTLRTIILEGLCPYRGGSEIPAVFSGRDEARGRLSPIKSDIFTVQTTLKAT